MELKSWMPESRLATCCISATGMKVCAFVARDMYAVSWMTLDKNSRLPTPVTIQVNSRWQTPSPTAKPPRGSTYYEVYKELTCAAIPELPYPDDIWVSRSKSQQGSGKCQYRSFELEVAGRQASPEQHYSRYVVGRSQMPLTGKTGMGFPCPAAGC